MGGRNQSKSFFRNASIVTVSQLAGAVTTTVAGILTARYLGPDGKGQVALAMSTGMILAIILRLGFHEAAPYYIASGKLASARVLGAWIITFVVATVFSYAVVYPLFTRYLMDSVFSGVSKSILLIGGLVCPLNLLRVVVNSILHGREEFVKRTSHDILIHLTTLIAAFLALVVFAFGPIGYVKMLMALGFISLGYGLYVLIKVIGFHPVFAISDWFKMLRYGSKATLSQIFNLIDLRLDIYFINCLTDISLVGVYTVAVAVGNLFWILPRSIAVVLFPRTASDPEQSRTLTSLLCRNVMWQAIILGGLFLLVSKQIIVFVFGERFSDASLALVFLMPGVIGWIVSRICYTDCSARGFPEKATISSAVTAALTIGFDILLIPKFGIFGAAVASSIAYCCGAVLGLHWHIKLSGNTLNALVVPRKSDLRYYKLILQKVRRKIF